MAKSTPNVFEELTAALGKHADADPANAKIRAKIVKAVSDDSFPEPKWKGLSKAAQDYINAGIDAINEKKDVAPFPGVEAAAESDDDEKETKTEKKAKKGGGDKAEKSEKKSKMPRGQACAFFRKAVIKNRKWTVQEVLDHCKEKGHDIAIGTAKQVYFNAHGMLDVLTEMEMIPAVEDKKSAKKEKAEKDAE